MRLLIAVLALVLIAVPAAAISVKDFEAKTPHEQSEIITVFVDKMTGDIGRTNPELAAKIHDYFFKKPEGKRYNEGLWNVSVEVSALDGAAKDGKADLSRIQIEGVIVKVVKDKFPPQR